MEIDVENFGKRIEKCMKKCNISNAKLTEELNLSKNAIGNYKNNQIPNASILYYLSKKLGVSMEYLLIGKEIDIGLNEMDKELLEYFSELPPNSKKDYLQEIKGAAKMYKSIEGKSSTSKIG